MSRQPWFLRRNLIMPVAEGGDQYCVWVCLLIKNINRYVVNRLSYATDCFNIEIKSV